MERISQIKPRYEMQQWEDGMYHILNPWTGCSIWSTGDREKALRVLAEHNGEIYQPEF